MWVLGPVGFTAPWLLLGLAALPVLWLILRAVPPAPIRRRFPGVALLLGLSDDETQADRTPWWLLLLRMIALAAAIIGFAGPVLNPQVERAGSGPLLILVDGTWADAGDWPRRLDRIEAALSEAGRAGRPVALALTTDLPPDGPVFQSADALAARLPGLTPRPWEPDPDTVTAWAAALDGRFETFWMSDGIARDSRAALLDALQDRGPVTAFESPRPVLALHPATYEDGEVRLSAGRLRGGDPLEVQVTAHGLDPAGIERALATVPLRFDAEATRAQVALSLPPELRNRITRFDIAGVRSAGAVSLADDSLRRREIALVAAQDDAEGLRLLSPVHYLQQALEPTADLIGGTLDDILLANPDVIILADVARLTLAESDRMQAWVNDGGLLVRFAGPRLAASDVSRDTEDPLMPVRLRAGGRTVGGAMSWGEPKGLRAFTEGSPFFGLPLPGDVSVSAQVLAQPDPQLADRAIAALDDGTPLVTRKALGQGQVILFHVTANAEWSTLPLSGLFVQMLERLAISSRPVTPGAADLEGTVWQAEQVLDAFGTVRDAGQIAGVPGERLAGRPAADLPPGLYAGQDRRIALNVIGPGSALAPMPWPASVPVEGLSVTRATDLKPFALTLALALLMVDILAALALSGRLRGPRAVATLAVALLGLGLAPQARAQDDAFLLEATSNVVLAHVLTGDASLDALAEAGLRGLSQRLYQRTAIEPADPMAVNLETDELSVFPFLYWPVSPDQATPSAEAYAKLNRYLRTGGMILFDTRDADIGNFGSATPAGRKLQALAAPLDIPPLEPIPTDHVLTRTFYLLQDFPGRHMSRDVWVEAAPPDAEQVEGIPFRDLNDGVTPVVIGGSDWAGAWAVDDRGAARLPVGRGFAGERQREIAYRFGINLIMHVLTGNYKSDQVHVPALLERLGQ
jgi:hypothetical protein